MKEKVHIVKVGGRILEQPETTDRFLHDFAALGGLKVLVHGGGRTATELAAKMGVKTRMIEGRRVTDDEMLRIVTMVYGGLVNKQVTARLQALGVNALGLTGADFDVMRAHKRPERNGVDFGWVGDVDATDGRRLAELLRSGVTPVMAPLTHDGLGHLLNTNADTIAAETAKALAEEFDVTLSYCFEHAGVLLNPYDEKSAVPIITYSDFLRLKAKGVISGGMIPKVKNCFDAVEAGVNKVIITRADALGGGRGTAIVGRIEA